MKKIVWERRGESYGEKSRRLRGKLERLEGNGGAYFWVAARPENLDSLNMVLGVGVKRQQLKRASGISLGLVSETGSELVSRTQDCGHWLIYGRADGIPSSPAPLVVRAYLFYKV